MDIGLLSLILFFSIFFLLAIGMPLGFASGALAVMVLFLKFGPDLLLSVPLFIFMASLLERSGIARDMFDSINIWLRKTRGGIAIVTAIMAIIMAAMSGIIGGEVVLLGLIALPQMLRLGYDQNLAIGTICAGGSLGTMIPPSIVLIVYGLITESSIHALFIAAVIPGLMMGGIYIAYVIVRTQLNPSLAPIDESIAAGMPLKERLVHARGIIAPVLLVFVVL